MLSKKQKTKRKNTLFFLEKSLTLTSKFDIIITMIDRIQIIREAHARVLAQQIAEQGASINELLPTTQEDVLDEAQRLDALDHEQEVDFDSDENEVDMNTISPQMRAIFS